MYGYILFILLFLVVAYIFFDFMRFAGKSKEERKGTKVDAGGVLFIQGSRTYYLMPNGSRRKIADYPMDLTPGSADMNAFTRIMAKAREEKITEATAKKKSAVANMIKVAKDAN